MTPAYLGHFALERAPFSKEISDVDLWMPPSKEALVHELCEALHERASIVLTGDPGAGKTCVLRALRHRLPQTGFRLTYCHNATLGRRDFYRQLCLALGSRLPLPPRHSSSPFPPTSKISAVSVFTRSSSSTRPTCSTRTCSTTFIFC